MLPATRRRRLQTDMRSIDLALFSMINAGAQTPRWLIDVAAFVSDVLPALLVGLVALGALFVRAWRAPLLMGLASLLLVWLVVTAFRSSVPVPRPAALGLGTQWAHQGIRPGFPSMHATTCFAFASSLLLARLWLPAALALAVALAVAWSRVFLGLHFPSDVAAGLVLGALVASLVWLCARRWLGDHVGRPSARTR